MPARGPFTEKHKANLSASLKLTFNTPEYKKQRSENQRAIWANPIHRMKLCAPKTEEHKAKMAMNATVECPHCGKEGSKVVMQRWHFDNCKKR